MGMRSPCFGPRAATVLRSRHADLSPSGEQASGPSGRHRASASRSTQRGVRVYEDASAPEAQRRAAQEQRACRRRQASGLGRGLPEAALRQAAQDGPRVKTPKHRDPPPAAWEESASLLAPEGALGKTPATRLQLSLPSARSKQPSES